MNPTGYRTDLARETTGRTHRLGNGVAHWPEGGSCHAACTRGSREHKESRKLGKGPWHSVSAATDRISAAGLLAGLAPRPRHAPWVNERLCLRAQVQQSPLHLAALGGHDSILRLLLLKDVDPDARDAVSRHASKLTKGRHPAQCRLMRARRRLLHELPWPRKAP